MGGACRPEKISDHGEKLGDSKAFVVHDESIVALAGM